MSKPSKPSKFTMKERREIIELMRELYPEAVVVSNKPDEIKTAHPNLKIESTFMTQLDPDALLTDK